jgi:cell division protein FtsW
VARTPAQPGTSAKSGAKSTTSAAPQAAPPTAPAASRAPSSATETAPGRWKQFRNRINSVSGRPGASYYWIIGTTVALTSIGLMTVLSASAAESISEGVDPYSLFIKEATFAAVGLVLMMGLSFVRPPTLKKLAWPALGLSGLLLMLVVFTPLGVNIGGNTNWINFGGSIQFQPSEAAKLALALWMGMILARKGELVKEWRHAFIPVVPVGVIMVGLILGGHDLGTAVIVMAVVGAGLFFGGASLKILVPAVVGGLGAAVILAAVSGNRTSRLSGWMGNCSADTGLCDQAQNGIYALASGRWFGVGLGQSRQKWSWIPEAHNDFIFAILGEELGLLGTLVIIALYGVMAFAIFRVIMKRNDTFARVVCGAILTWIIGQAFVNIAMVTGLLPVIGVPLPLISYGGSALVVVLAAIGVVLSFAREEPESALKQK